MNNIYYWLAYNYESFSTEISNWLLTNEKALACGNGELEIFIKCEMQNLISIYAKISMLQDS